MKLRLRQNSIRLRLLKSEIEQLRETGSITEFIHFQGSNKLAYTVLIDDTTDSISTDFQDNEVSIRVPSETADRWINTEQIGIERNQVIDEGLTLNILLEKDFVCLTRPMEGDNLDAFPNPSGEPC